MKYHRSISTLVTFAAAGALARADVKLPAIISDNMVLQQETEAGVWGWADPDEKVTVTFAGKTATATPGADGKWVAKLSDLESGKTGDMTVAGKNSITVKNVIVGEVWVCSGQSNMEMSVSGVQNAADEIAAADFPLVRMFTVQRHPATEPQKDCAGKWEITTPANVPHFSAVGYFFGRRLHQTLKRPIGLIHTSWGGTPAEFWTPREILERDADFKPFVDAWEKKVAAYPKAKADFDEALAKWNEAVKQAKEAGTPPPKTPQPRPPQGGGPDGFGGPGCLYNGMIAPILDYSIRGATWYQGESNASQAQLYQKLFPTMIMSWRALWRSEFPFLFVQLANYLPRHDEPTDSSWARLREAQLMTLELPHTGMAVAIDIGDGANIHPKNKQEVGRRLALAAEATVYFIDQEFSGPIFTSSQEEDGKIRLSFRNADGMKASDGGKLKGFAVAGEDRKFAWADAEIQGDHIVLSCPQVPKPVAARYGWADNPEVNLINSTGLPASPFRTDDWPLVQQAAK